MNQSELYHSVARATGETVDVIRSVGFTLLAPLVTEPDEASRWLHRAQQRRSFRHNRRRRPYSRQTCIVG